MRSPVGFDAPISGWVLTRPLTAGPRAEAAEARPEEGRREIIKYGVPRFPEIVLPRSPMGQAITYAKNQWAALCTYTTQGFLSIDNNAAERALKRVAIGRRNWLFAGNDEAAANHAKLWTLIASAERHGIDPQRYLTSVLAKLPSTPPDELNQFLPDVWKKDDAAEPVPG